MCIRDSHKTEQEIREEFEFEFDTLINEGDMGKIASKYPDVAALLWVLADSTDENEDNDD